MNSGSRDTVRWQAWHKSRRTRMMPSKAASMSVRVLEAMRCEWMFGWHSAVAGAMRIGVSKLLGVLLDRTGERCRSA